MPVRIYAMILGSVFLAAAVTVFFATQFVAYVPLPAMVGVGSVPVLLILYLIVRKK